MVGENGEWNGVGKAKGGRVIFETFLKQAHISTVVKIRSLFVVHFESPISLEKPYFCVVFEGVKSRLVEPPCHFIIYTLGYSC